jgi:tripartite-type tricarboxylate transporter receptor subunit TctC
MMMLLDRLRIGALCVFALTGLVAEAADYPGRPIQMVIPFPPGAIVDVLARSVAQSMSDTLGQPVIVESRPGATGTMGTASVVRSKADGYTLLFSPASTQTLTPLLMKLQYNPVVDLIPVGMVARTPLILVVNPNVPVTTVPELIGWLKSSSGSASFGSYGNGSASHLAGELFKLKSGTEMVHIAYKGAGPAQIDLMGGQTAVMFSDVSAMQHVRSGKLRALAVTSRERSQAFPELPPIADTLPGFDITAWFAVFAPAATPMPVLERLRASLKNHNSSARAKSLLQANGLDQANVEPADLAKFMQSEQDRYRELMKAAKVSLE